MARIPEHAARLLTSSIESIERLDLLLHLRAEAPHAFGARALAAALHVTPQTVETDLAVLCGRGFLTVNIGSDLLYAYKPVSTAIEEVLAELEALNRVQRADIVSALAARTSRDSGHAFANSVLVRKREA